MNIEYYNWIWCTTIEYLCTITDYKGIIGETKDEPKYIILGTSKSYKRVGEEQILNKMVKYSIIKEERKL